MICGSDTFLDGTVVAFAFGHMRLGVGINHVYVKFLSNWVQQGAKLIVGMDSGNLHAGIIVDLDNFR